MKKQLIIAVRRRVASTRSSVLGPRPWGASLLGVRRLGWAWALAWGSAWGWARGWPWAGLGPRFGAGLGPCLGRFSWGRCLGLGLGLGSGLGQWAGLGARPLARLGAVSFSGSGLLGALFVGRVSSARHWSMDRLPSAPPTGPTLASNGRASAPIASQAAPLRPLVVPYWAPHGPPMAPHRDPIGATSAPQWAQIGAPSAPHRPSWARSAPASL